MDIQQPLKQEYASYSINETHNLVVQNIVQNHQVKFIVFHDIQHIKILYKNQQQHRFLTGLVVAGRNFIKLYAIFSNQVYQELAFYKIHEDITGLYSWDKQKCIVIQTKQKVIGLTYEQGMLKNAFMLSLQFLPLNSNDTCKCAFDRRGFMFTIIIKNFLLLCFSNEMIKKKGKPIYKEYTEIVTEDIKWNRSEKAYVEEVIKIKISDFQLSKIQNMNICNEALYFIGLKNFEKPNEKQEYNEKAFYQIQAPYFFDDKHPKVIQLLAKKNPQVISMTPYVYNNQMQCLFCKTDSIEVQIGKQMVLVDQYADGDYKIIHRNTTDCFSLWVKTGNMIIAYYRNANGFVNKMITVNFYFDNFLLKEEFALSQGTIIYSNETELCVLSLDLSFAKKLISNSSSNNQIQEEVSLNEKNSVKMHKSFGNIVDFQFGKNSILMVESRLGVDESQESKFQVKSKLYELKRGLVTDPRPYITHEKKNFLQDILTKEKLKSIKTLKFKFGHPNQQQTIYTDNVIVTQSHSLQNKYTFYRQMVGDTSKQKASGFQSVLEGVSYYGKVSHQEIDYLVMINEKGQYWVEKDCSVDESTKFSRSVSKLQLDGFIVNENQNQHMAKRIFFIDSLIIYQIAHTANSLTFNILDVFKLEDAKIEITVGQGLVNMFMRKKRHSFRKKDKLSLVIEITLVYQNSVQIFELYPLNKDLQMIYKCQNISQGPPSLSNYISHNEQDNSLFQKDKFRSITCPEYILSSHHTQDKHHTIRNASIYTYRDISYLILVNSLDELIVYKKSLSFQNDSGFVYKRVMFPMNIVKVFRYHDEENAIDQLGEGMLKICNVLICKGQFLEHNVHHLSYFQMDSFLWTIEKQKIKMIDLKPLAGSNQPLFRQTYRKDSKDFTFGTDSNRNIAQTLQENIEIMSNFILTPIRTMMRKELMGLQISGDYFMIYSKSGFEVLNQKDMKPVWACNLSSQNPERKEVIINARLYDHYIAVSYYDYILDQSTEFKSIKFKFRIYNILSKKKILEKPKSTDEPILHIRPISAERILLATSTTLFIYQIKGEKSLEPIRTRNFSKRFGLSTFSYIPEVFDQKNRLHKPCYMLLANQFGGLSFFVGKWIEGDILREMWFEKIRCHIRNVQLFHYGQALKGLITDEDGNLIVINLKPDTPQEPAKAQKLADINVGAKANVLRIRHQQDRKIYGCFEDGTIKSISSVKLDNPQISLIDFQQQSFCKQIPFMGGFNQRSSRLMHQKYRTFKYVSRGNIVDCDILEEFFSMTVNLKQYILEKSQLRLEQLKAVVRSI